MSPRTAAGEEPGGGTARRRSLLRNEIYQIMDMQYIAAGKNAGQIGLQALAGIYSAGTAQRLVNMEGFLPGREVVVLGSGDIGLIMARRMTLEGAKVHVVAELDWSPSSRLPEDRR